MRCPKFAHPPFRSANFDRGTRFCLAQSAFCGARQRVPRHAPRAECSITSIVQKETSAAVAVLVFFGRGRRTQPFAVPEIRLPSLSLCEFRPRHPLSARFFRFRGAHQRAPRLAPPAECSIINTVQKETSAAVAVLVFFGRGRRTRTLGTRFWRTNPFVQKVLISTRFQGSQPLLTPPLTTKQVKRHEVRSLYNYLYNTR